MEIFDLLYLLTVAFFASIYDVIVKSLPRIFDATHMPVFFQIKGRKSPLADFLPKSSPSGKLCQPPGLPWQWAGKSAGRSGIQRALVSLTSFALSQNRSVESNTLGLLASGFVIYFTTTSPSTGNMSQALQAVTRMHS